MKHKKSAPRHSPGHLSHTSHTGKRLPRQHTSYPILLFLLLCLGVFMAGLTLKARAVDVNVSAISEGPPPPAPAIITSPAEDTHFTDLPITVKGSCPARFMVKLYRNDVFAGAALCALDDTFQIQTGLFEGPNQLKARIFNAVEDEGPTSPAIQVFYDPPPAPTPNSPTGSTNQTPAGSGQSSPAAIPPLIIRAENLFRGYYTGDQINWPLDIVGGTAPYALSVDWGDGNTSVFSRKQSGDFSIHHVYAAAGPNQDAYAIKLTVSDANDNKTYLQLMVIIRDKSKTAFATVGSTSGLPPLHVSFKGIWPAYVVTTLMAVSFWLGSQQSWFGFLHSKPHMKGSHR